MATGLSSWSKTAASNATADSNVSMVEGMAPSAVNDGIRAAMASASMYRDDVNGSITTTGTSTAYVVTSNQSFASLSAMGNAVIAFVPHTTNGDAPTLAVDGLTAKKIRFETGTDIPSDSLIEGTPYVVTYYASVGEFILHNIAGNPYNIPLAGGLDYWGTTTPNSAFVFPYGQAISRTTYATLFAIMSTTHGVGDGSTTFNLPDKRGRASAGKDDMGGSSANRLTNQTGGLNGDTLGATGGAETHTLTAAQAPANMAGTGTGVGSGSIGASNFGLFSGSNALAAGGSTINNVIDAGTNALSITVTSLTVNVNATGGSAHNNVQPTIVCNYILRVI